MKELKKKARKNLKSHYLLLVFVLLFASLIGSEFSSSLTITQDFGDNVITAELETKEKLENETKEKIEEEQKEKEQKLQDEESKILGRSNGVFSAIVNSFSTNSFYTYVISFIQTITGSYNVASIIVIIISLIFILSVWYILINTYQVITRRLFLESSTYKKVEFEKFLFLFRFKKLLKVAKSLLRQDLVYAKWIIPMLLTLSTSITSFGFDKYILGTVFMLITLILILQLFVVYCSLCLVPFILAENPNVTGKEANKLSRKMMMCNKLEFAKIRLSFIGWELLGMVTFGISNVLYTNPYIVATLTEFYKKIRKEFIDKKIEDYELLNDKYLYEYASKEVLNKEYGDVIDIMSKTNTKPKLSKAKEFFVSYLGISFLNDKESKEFNNYQINKVYKLHYNTEINGESYPDRLFTLKESKNKEEKNITYLRPYSSWSLIMMFFIFAFIGWSWEVAIHLVEDGAFVNRGILHGPWLPIYGAGGLAILILLYKFRKQPIKEFIAAIIVCGIIEYFTSYFLEIMHDGQKWWDYSGYFLNLNGRICAEGLLVFGLGGLAVVYIFAPILDNKLKKIDKKILVPLCIALITLYIGDTLYSSKYPNTGKGITDYNTENVEKVE